MASPFGSVPGVVVGVGVGTAAAAALVPVVEPARQEAWKANPNRLLNPATMARLVAQGGVTLGAAHTAGEREGLTNDKVNALVYLEQHAPGIAEALRLRRRDFITDGQLDHVLAKAQIEPQYWPGLKKLVPDILDPADLARAIHRGLVPDPGLLQGNLPAAEGKVPAYPVYPINAIDEAAGSGIDHDRLGVLVGLQGNPMGPHEAAQAEFRGILTRDDFLRAIAEGNTRNEWAEAIREQTRQIPTARDFMENALRGHHDFDWAATHAARHGMSREDAFIIYQNQGRPLNLHQITQGLAWGGDYQPGPGDNADPWMQSVLLGAVRPEYYNLQHSLKYLLPSAFYFRTLQEQGVITESEAVTWYERIGWPPDLAAKVAKAYAKTTATAAPDPLVTKAENQLWTAIHRDYVKMGVPRAAADTALQALTQDAAVRNRVFALWDDERRLNATQAPAA